MASFCISFFPQNTCLQYDLHSKNQTYLIVLYFQTKSATETLILNKWFHFFFHLGSALKPLNDEQQCRKCFATSHSYILHTWIQGCCWWKCFCTKQALKGVRIVMQSCYKCAVILHSLHLSNYKQLRKDNERENEFFTAVFCINLFTVPQLLPESSTWSGWFIIQ